MLLVIDNYDSFTYNIVQYLGELGFVMRIFRNDENSIDAIRALNPERILISPGPCSPRESGLSNDIIRTFGPSIPTLGVCLADWSGCLTNPSRNSGWPWQDLQ